jgi:anti-sigma factor RsiW
VNDLDCNELVELVTAYLDGSLDPHTAQRAAEHLQGCDGCTTYVEQFRQTIATLGALPSDELPAASREALLAAFRGLRPPV